MKNIAITAAIVVATLALLHFVAPVVVKQNLGVN